MIKDDRIIEKNNYCFLNRLRNAILEAYEIHKRNKVYLCSRNTFSFPHDPSLKICGKSLLGKTLGKIKKCPDENLTEGIVRYLLVNHDVLVMKWVRIYVPSRKHWNFRRNRDNLAKTSEFF